MPFATQILSNGGISPSSEQNPINYNLLAMTQLMAGGGIVIIAQTVIPQLTTLFS